MNNKHANHTNYSDHRILAEVNKFKGGEYRFKTEAFRTAAKKLGLREDQVAARYYELAKDNISIFDVSDYTEEDINNFYPGSGEVKTYAKRSNKSNDSKKGSKYERGIAKKKASAKVVLTKNEDNTETVDFKRLREVIKSLTKNAPANTKLDIMSDLANDL